MTRVNRKAGQLRRCYATKTAGHRDPCLFGTKADALANQDADEDVVLVEYRIVGLVKKRTAAIDDAKRYIRKNEVDIRLHALGQVFGTPDSPVSHQPMDVARKMLKQMRRCGESGTVVVERTFPDVVTVRRKP